MPKVSSLIAEYNDNMKNIEGLKNQVYLAAMFGNNSRVNELREVIVKYESDLREFEQQEIEYKHVGME